MSGVLVTGGSGFIAGHCIAQLLAAGHQVRATLRSLAREGDVRAALKDGGGEPGADRLTFAAADLTGDAGWPQAVAGCEYVLHVASPFPPGAPRDEDELIRPAREGTLRVLRAARAAGVRRVVLTSSFAAVGYGHPDRDAPFDETSWTDVSGRVSAYVKSKTIAEKAAWDFMAADGGDMELAAVNPVAVLGPVMGADYASSILLVRRLLDGEIPALPRLMFGIVDVRDVADLHLRAMVDPAARGQRFLAVAGDFMPLVDVAAVLKARLGAVGQRVTTRVAPDWVVRLAALFSPEARGAAPELGRTKNATSEKARRLLGWRPRPAEDAIVATAESLSRLGLLKPLGR
jgi:nucleoside-diphosphate-sugar epimerase